MTWLNKVPTSIVSVFDAPPPPCAKRDRVSFIILILWSTVLRIQPWAPCQHPLKKTRGKHPALLRSMVHHQEYGFISNPRAGECGKIGIQGSPPRGLHATVGISIPLPFHTTLPQFSIYNCPSRSMKDSGYHQNEDRALFVHHVSGASQTPLITSPHSDRYRAMRRYTLPRSNYQSPYSVFSRPGWHKMTSPTSNHGARWSLGVCLIREQQLAALCSPLRRDCSVPLTSHPPSIIPPSRQPVILWYFPLDSCKQRNRFLST